MDRGAIADTHPHIHASTLTHTYTHTHTHAPEQGDQERAKNLPVSTFMDRATTLIPKCQVGFLDYIVTPLFEAWNGFMNEDGSFEGMANLVKNREYWKSAPENYELASVLVQEEP